MERVASSVSVLSFLSKKRQQSGAARRGLGVFKISDDLAFDSLLLAGLCTSCWTTACCACSLHFVLVHVLGKQQAREHARREQVEEEAVFVSSVLDLFLHHGHVVSSSIKKGKVLKVASKKKRNKNGGIRSNCWRQGLGCVL